MKTKVGDIVFREGEFVEVVRIEWTESTIKKRIPSGKWWKPDKTEDTDKKKRRLKGVWWDKLGIDDGIIHSTEFSNHENWDAMMLEAVPLLKQAKIALSMIETKEKEEADGVPSKS